MMQKGPMPPWMMPPPEFFQRKMAEFKKNQAKKYDHKDDSEKTTGELVDEVLKEADTKEEEQAKQAKIA